MEVNFTPEQEAQLARIAIKVGTDLERLVKEAALRLLHAETYVSGPVSELPVWHLGPIGSMHRRDVYRDAR
jgi:hypothetical protein